MANFREEDMVDRGVARVAGAFNAACNTGRATTAPAMARPIRVFTQEMARQLAEAFKAPHAQCPGHLTHLRMLSPEAVAVVAVRASIDAIIGPDKVCTLRSVAGAVGRSVFRELVMTTVVDRLPHLATLLERTYDRSRTREEAFKVEGYLRVAEKHGVVVPTTSPGDKEKLGVYLTGVLAAIGMINILPPSRVGRGLRSTQQVVMTDEVYKTITAHNKYLTLHRPVYDWCRERPRDWVNHMDGGYHTKALISANPTLVRHRLGSCQLFETTIPEVVYTSINSQQRTAWEVNPEIFKVCGSGNIKLEEVPTRGPPEMPTRPQELCTKEVYKLKHKDLPEGLKAVHIEWVVAMSDWHRAKSDYRRLLGKFLSAMQSARAAEAGPLYFVHFLDSRGRAYPLAGGMNPQGTDLQRALLRFHVGAPVTTEPAIKWFLINGANRFGFDKAPLRDRVNWVHANAPMIISCAEDPYNNKDWQGADSPLSFLAWCLEYVAWRAQPSKFQSKLPVSVDGTCNGLQHLSAMFRDPIGGGLTNLTANAARRDAYTEVASATHLRLLKGDTPAARWWAQTGVRREAVKRMVMTTPYGVTRTSATQYVVDDYLRVHHQQDVEIKDMYIYARELVDAAWVEIANLLPKATQALTWLTAAGGFVCKATPPGEPVVWPTPDGFPALQRYNTMRRSRVLTHLHGRVTISLLLEDDRSSVIKHKQGFAPNFVHSMDAAHMHRVTAAITAAGARNLAMTHDSFATTPDYAEELYHQARKCFVEMYTGFDPIKSLTKAYPGLPPPPTVGTLDINEVMHNEFSFS